MGTQEITCFDLAFVKLYKILCFVKMEFNNLLQKIFIYNKNIDSTKTAVTINTFLDEYLKYPNFSSVYNSFYYFKFILLIGTFIFRKIYTNVSLYTLFLEIGQYFTVGKKMHRKLTYHKIYLTHNTEKQCYLLVIFTSHSLSSSITR